MEKKNSRERYCDRGQRQENPDRAKNQSDCWIRYRARLEKNKVMYFYDLQFIPSFQSCNVFFHSCYFQDGRLAA